MLTQTLRALALGAALTFTAGTALATAVPGYVTGGGGKVISQTTKTTTKTKKDGTTVTKTKTTTKTENSDGSTTTTRTKDKTKTK